MVFYDNFAKPSPSRRSMSIEGKLYYDKPSTTNDFRFSPVIDAPSTRKTPKTPVRAMLKDASQPSLSPSKDGTKKSNDLLFRDFPLHHVIPSQYHHSNTVEFSTIEGLALPSFDLNNDDTKDPFNESLSKQVVDFTNNESPVDARVSSWSNLDFCINLSDIETDLPPMDSPHVESKVLSDTTPVVNQHGIASLSKQRPSHSHEVRPPVSPLRRMARKISQRHKHNSLPTGTVEGNNTKSNLQSKPKGHLRKQNSAFDVSISQNNRNACPTDRRKNCDRHMSLNPLDQSFSEASEITFIASPRNSPKKQMSVDDLLSPDVSRSCLPRWKAIPACDPTLSPLPSKSLKASNSMRDNHLTPTTQHHASPFNQRVRSLCKQVSERMIASPKWSNHTEGGGRCSDTNKNKNNNNDMATAKKLSIPKVDSVQILLSEFDKIMELDSL